MGDSLSLPPTTPRCQTAGRLRQFILYTGANAHFLQLHLECQGGESAETDLPLRGELRVGSKMCASLATSMYVPTYIIDNIKKMSKSFENIIFVTPCTIFAANLRFCTWPEFFGICNRSKGGMQVMHLVLDRMHSWLGPPLLLSPR